MGCTPSLGKAKIKKTMPVEKRDPTPQPRVLLGARSRLNSNDAESVLDLSSQRKLSLYTVREEQSALEQSAAPSPVVGQRLMNHLKEQQIHPVLNDFCDENGLR